MKIIIAGLVLLGMVAGLVPFGLITLARSQTTTNPPVHPIQDMFHQQKFRPQRENPMFADLRAMRPAIGGTVAQQDLQVPNEPLNDPLHPRMIDDRSAPYTAQSPEQWQALTEGTRMAGDKPAFVEQIPSDIKVTEDLMHRGRERFNIYCAACHGQSGYGDGTVSRRAAEMQSAGADTASGWVAPTNYHTDEIRNRPVGHIFNTITNGIRSMPSYAKQISVVDRWAIVAYVRALQRSQKASIEDVPDTDKADYK
jgi:mono/diheme cytochrome c family protein